MSAHAPDLSEFSPSMMWLFMVLNYRLSRSGLKYLITWLTNTAAYLLFVIYCIRSGFGWWMDKTDNGFGIIDLIFAFKELLFIVAVFIEARVQNLVPEDGNYESAEHGAFRKFQINDLIMHLNNLVFWVFSAIYAFYTRVTPEKLADPGWLQTTASLNS